MSFAQVTASACKSPQLSYLIFLEISKPANPKSPPRRRNSDTSASTTMRNTHLELSCRLFRARSNRKTSHAARRAKHAQHAAKDAPRRRATPPHPWDCPVNSRSKSSFESPPSPAKALPSESIPLLYAASLRQFPAQSDRLRPVSIPAYYLADQSPCRRSSESHPHDRSPPTPAIAREYLPDHTTPAAP